MEAQHEQERRTNERRGDLRRVGKGRRVWNRRTIDAPVEDEQRNSLRRAGEARRAGAERRDEERRSFT